MAPLWLVLIDTLGLITCQVTHQCHDKQGLQSNLQPNCCLQKKKVPGIKNTLVLPGDAIIPVLTSKYQSQPLVCVFITAVRLMSERQSVDIHGGWSGYLGLDDHTSAVASFPFQAVIVQVGWRKQICLLSRLTFGHFFVFYL